jgi:hypothetical protein
VFSWSPIKYNSYYCFTSLHTILVFVIIFFFFSFSPLYQENRPKKTSVQCQMCSHLGRIKLKNTAPSVTCFPGDLLFLPTNVMADNNSRFDYLPTMDELLNTVENKVQLNSKYTAHTSSDTTSNTTSISTSISTSFPEGVLAFKGVKLLLYYVWW